MFYSDSKVSLTQATSQTFTKVGSKYVGQAGVITLHQRTEYTERKPKFYLIYQPSREAKPAYLTGLYPQASGGFIGEKNGVYWRIDLTDEAIKFEIITQGTQSVSPSEVLRKRHLKSDATTKPKTITTKP